LENKAAHILNNVTVITYEKESATVWKVDLHSNQAFEQNVVSFGPVSNHWEKHTVGVARKMMKRDSLAKVHSAVIKRFPVQG
jgi:hypothetical protein